MDGNLLRAILFDSVRRRSTSVAQTSDQKVAGSSPAGCTIHYQGLTLVSFSLICKFDTAIVYCFMKTKQTTANVEDCREAQALAENFLRQSDSLHAQRHVFLPHSCSGQTDSQEPQNRCAFRGQTPSDGRGERGTGRRRSANWPFSAVAAR